MVNIRKSGKTKKHLKKNIMTNKPLKRKKHVQSAEGPQHVPQQPATGYNRDTIVVMPVNSDTSFVYWEVTDRLLRGNIRKLKSGSAQLMIRVFGKDANQEICSFETKDRIGKSYINYKPPLIPLVAEIGISNGTGFVGLLKSKSAQSPSPGKASASGSAPVQGPHKRKREVWMTFTEKGREMFTIPFNERYMTGAEIREYYRRIKISHAASLFSRT